MCFLLSLVLVLVVLVVVVLCLRVVKGLKHKSKSNAHLFSPSSNQLLVLALRMPKKGVIDNEIELSSLSISSTRSADLLLCCLLDYPAISEQL